MGQALLAVKLLERIWMKTKLFEVNGYIALVVDEPGKSDEEKDVLAAMTEYEGTECWQVVDIRLAAHRAPSKYAGGLIADVLHSTFKPDSLEDAAFIKSKLREFREDQDGTLHWCTFEGIVRGQPNINGYAPAWISLHDAGYFSRADGLAQLLRIKSFWDEYEGDPGQGKIDNQLRQASESELRVLLHIHRLTAKIDAPVDADPDYLGGPEM